MNRIDRLSRKLWLTLLVAFATLNLWAMTSDGVAGFLAYLGSLSPVGLLATVDLVIALLIGIVFVTSDARRRGLDPRPFVVLTALTGSLGLLAYLARRYPEPPGLGEAHADGAGPGGRGSGRQDAFSRRSRG